MSKELGIYRNALTTSYCCIPLDLWALNSPDLNPVDYRISGVMQDRVYQTAFRDMAYLRQRLIDTWNDLSQSVVDDAVLMNGARDFRLV